MCIINNYKLLKNQSILYLMILNYLMQVFVYMHITDEMVSSGELYNLLENFGEEDDGENIDFYDQR